MAKLFGKKKDKDASAKGDTSTDSGSSSTGDSGASGGGSGGGSVDTDFRRDARKATRFFEHAQTVADAQQWDYAVDCIISGLRHDPDNIARHDQLRDIAVRRKVSGGKPAGMAEKFKSIGKGSIAKMLDAEKLWAKDPTNVDHVLKAMEKAIDADEVEDELNMGEVAYWLGERGMEINDGAKKRSKSVYVKLIDLFSRFGGWDKAVECARRAITLDQNDDSLIERLRDLETEEAMYKGGYGQNRDDADERRDEIRKQQTEETRKAAPAAKQRGSSLDGLIAERLQDYKDDADNGDKLMLLVDVLVQKEGDAGDKQAVSLLKQAYEKTNEYRFKLRMGDITMRWMKNQYRALKTKHQADPDNAELKQKFEDFYRKMMQFELHEYTDRVKHFPNDNQARFEMGKRLLSFKKVDDAIAVFQQVQNDPKIQGQALMHLGQGYQQKGWLKEAAEALHKAVERYPGTDGAALTVRYQLMDLLEQIARQEKSLEYAQKAEALASEILQARINFRDIAKRLDGLRTLLSELRT